MSSSQYEVTETALAGVGGGAPVLDRWDVLTHKYRFTADAKLGFLGKLFSGSGKSVRAGVTQEAKQYRLDQTDDGRVVETGVAVRLAVATTSFDAQTELSVPNLAAAAQLGLAETRIGIYVMGFRGPIGDIMPAPADLNVENFGSFMDAFEAIQKRVFSIESVPLLSPTVLGYQDTSEDATGTFTTEAAFEVSDQTDREKEIDLSEDAHLDPDDDARLSFPEYETEALRPWRVAESLLQLRDQVNKQAPNRSKKSDGSIGDAAHATRASDHNPWVVDGSHGVVTAIDITHDPDNGFDAEKLAKALQSTQDPRLKYIIWNRRILSSTKKPWKWRNYSGSNPHTKHIHISVHSEKSKYDGTGAWTI
ncbi:hypothetical protein [Microbulbifer sp. S227A]|uniref:hypothetical protein n=1 Tax=Microbulbifer sp. S227A TaxID=3415131 RepID=UPI003C7DDFD8